MRLNRAMIFVNDLSGMTSFYSTTLGLKVVQQMEDYVEFETGGAGFALHAIPASLKCAPSSPVRPRESNPLKLSFQVDDAESERKRLEALGVQILVRSWGACDGVDPEGNVFGIYSTSNS